MYRKITLAAAFFLLGSFGVSSAQESKHFTTQPEHEFLERFEGEWTFERFSPATDGEAPERLGAGEVSAELLGEIFVISRWSGRIYGLDYTGVQTLGYDVDRESYSGTWVDNFMSHQWQLDGSLVADGSEFTLAAEGPALDGSVEQFREHYRFESDDTITILAEMKQDDEWVAVSTTRLTRKPGTAQRQSR